MAQNSAPGATSDQPEGLQQLLEKVRSRFEAADKVHTRHVGEWDELYGLYRGYRDLKAAMSGRSERDRDGALNSAKREWGADLFIPYSYTVIETILPRVISTEPKMLVKPRTPDAQDSAQRVQQLIDVQQKDIAYDLKLQSVARSGLKYGLGVQKTFWQHEERTVLRNVPRKILPGYQTVQKKVVVRDGPQVEPVNIRDFFWEPSASSIETCGWVIHRTWRTQDYVKDQVESGNWFPIDLERISGMASDAVSHATSSVQNDTITAVAGGSPTNAKLHEVWEYHERGTVVTILDRQLVVQNDVAPFFHRELPFQIYRPTPQEHEFVGIGEIEPIKHLQYELNTLRSQRRDNATLVLQKAFLYAEGFVDPDDLKIGPARGIPIKGANINDVIKPLEFGDIPGSSYQEASEIKADIERTTGVSDAVAGAAGSSGTAGTDTATGIQLIQAAANVRIALKAANLMDETVREAGRQFLELNRQHILTDQQIRIENPGQEGGYEFSEVGPEQLLSDLDDPIPEAGSTEPDNPVAKQNAALTLYQALQANPSVDRNKLAKHLLDEYGVSDSEGMVIPDDTVPVDPRVLGEALVAAGMDEQAVLQALEVAMTAATTPEEDQMQAAEGGVAPEEEFPEEEQQAASEGS